MVVIHYSNYFRLIAPIFVPSLAWDNPKIWTIPKLSEHLNKKVVFIRRTAKLLLNYLSIYLGEYLD